MGRVMRRPQNGPWHLRIQDFPLGGADTLEGRRYPPMRVLFSGNVKTKELGPVGGGRPLDPPMLSPTKSISMNELNRVGIVTEETK